MPREVDETRTIFGRDQSDLTSFQDAEDQITPAQKIQRDRLAKAVYLDTESLPSDRGC